MTEDKRPARRRPGNDFSRLPSVQEQDPSPVLQDSPTDSEGRRALFSAPPPAPHADRPAAPGAVVVDCGGCGESSVLTPAQALALAVPSIHLPYLRRGHGSWMRCPSCRRRTWVSIQIQL